MAGDQNSDRFARIIEQRLTNTRGTGDAQCLDASIIAAYRERSLRPDERARSERHIAQCARCSSALAALARIDDAVEAGSVTHARAAHDDGRAWWRLRGPLSLAAFGAGAAVLIIVALKTFATRPRVIDREGRAHLEDRQAQSLASNGAPAAAKGEDQAVLGTGNSLLAMNEAAHAKPEAPLKRRSPEAFEKSDHAAAAFARPQAAGSRSSVQALQRSRDQLKERDEPTEKAGRDFKFDRRKAESTSAPVDAIVSSESPTRPPVTRDAAGAQSSLPSSAPAAPDASAPRVGAGAGIEDRSVNMQAGRRGSMSGANAIVIEAPGHTAAWRLGANGSIARYSATTGWLLQSSGVTTDLTGGAALSTTTCWVVGRGGTILRTVDGTHWTTIVAPVAEDLTDVIAGSAASATITAASGRRFATVDGGVTWRPLR